MKMRINKFIALNSQLSRREVDELISQGRVLVNNKLAKRGMFVDTEEDDIIVDFQKIINRKKQYTYLLLYKPKNIITSRKDEKHRPTVIDLLPEKFKHLKPAGRLDFNTEGLIILTDDGDFINYITHPLSKVEKLYRAKIFGKLNIQDIKTLKKGIKIKNKIYKLDSVKSIHYNEKNNKSIVEIILSHGKKNEIKVIMKALGHPVVELKRIAIGNLSIKEMNPGEFKKFSKEDFSQKVK